MSQLPSVTDIKVKGNESDRVFNFSGVIVAAPSALKTRLRRKIKHPKTAEDARITALFEASRTNLDFFQYFLWHPNLA